MKTDKLSKWTIIFLAAAVMALAVGAASGQARKPLVQDGKTALYQRVIAAPGAMLVADPARPSETRGVPPEAEPWSRRRRCASAWGG